MNFFNPSKLYTIALYRNGLYQLNTHDNLTFMVVLTLLNLLSLCSVELKSHLVSLYQVLLLSVCHLCILCSLCQFFPYISLPCFSILVQYSLTNTSSVYLFRSQTTISHSSFSLQQHNNLSQVTIFKLNISHQKLIQTDGGQGFLLLTKSASNLIRSTFDRTPSLEE